MKGRKMRKIFTLLAFLLLASIAPALDPATITCTNFREEAVSDASSAVFYRGDVINFTNCVMFFGTDTNSARQNLTNLTVVVTWGDTVNASTSVTGSITTATSGVWNAAVTLRTTESAKIYFQMKITNSTDVFVYPFKTITTKAKL